MLDQHCAMYWGRLIIEEKSTVMPISLVFTNRFLLSLICFTVMAVQALLTRIGFSVAQANALIDEGITDLVTYTHSNVKTLFKHMAGHGVHPPFRAQHKFQILRYWVEKRTPLGLDIDSALFTNNELTT
jgi:hypothetical protein